MVKTVLNVTGMTCGHCVSAVTRALEQVPGVERVDVTLQPGQAVVYGDADHQALIEAIKEEGYEAKPAA